MENITYNTTKVEEDVTQVKILDINGGDQAKRQRNCNHVRSKKGMRDREL